MKKQESLKIILAIRVTQIDPEKFLNLLYECLQISGDISIPGKFIHWNIPVIYFEPFQTDKTMEIIKKIETLIKDSGAVILPAGYSGADHTILFKKELKREIEPSGFSTSPGLTRINSQKYIMPLYSDTFRPSVQNVYKSLNAILLQLLLYPDKQTGIVTATIGNQKKRIPTIRISSSAKNSGLGDLKRAIAGESKRLFLIVDIASEEDTTLLKNTFTQLNKYNQKKEKVSFTTIDCILNELKHYTPKDNRLLKQERNLHVTPIERYPLRYARKAGGTFRYITEREIKNRLRDLSHPNHLIIPGFKKDNKPNGFIQRELISDMTGSTFLWEENFSIHFLGGRFSGIYRDGNPVTTDKTASSYFKSDKKTFRWKRISSFSFESENTRGLREDSAIISPLFRKSGSLVVDHFFAEGFPHLLTSITVDYPVLKTECIIDSFALLEISALVMDRDETIALEAIYPEGEVYKTVIYAEEKEYIFPGNRFYFTKGNTTFLIAFPEFEQQFIDILSVRVIKSGKKFILQINPGGSYQKRFSSDIGSFKEHFTIIMGAGKRDLLEVPPIPKLLKKELEIPWIEADYKQ